MPKVPYIDQSGLYAIEDAVITLKKRGMIVLFTGIQEQPKDMLINIRLIPELIPEVHIFENFTKCIAALEAGAVEADPERSKKINWKY